MAGLRLSIDPTGMVAGAKQGETALELIKRKADEAERATDKFGDGAKKAGDKAGAAAPKIKAAGAEMGSVTALAAKAGSALGALAAGFVSMQTLGAAVASARDFNAALAETSTLIAGTPAEMSALESGARSLAVAFGTDATAQVQAFYQAISAGAGSVAEAQTLLETANRLAVGGVTQVTTAVDILTTATNVYKAEGLSAADASDALFVAMKAGKTTIGELSSTLGKVLPLSQALGITFDETAAAVAALTKSGLGTAEAVTGLRASMVSILAPSADAQKLAARLGLDFSAAGLEAQGFAGFMAEVVAKTGGSTEKMQQLFGSVEAVGAALSFSGGAGQFMADIMGDMGEKAGATQSAFDKINESLSGRLNRALAALRDILLGVGNILLPVLVPVLEATAAVVRLVADNADVLATTLGLLAITRIPAMIAGVGAMITGMTGLAGAAGVATVASGALAAAMNLIPLVAVATGVALVVRAWANFKPAIQGAGDSIDVVRTAQVDLNAALATFSNDRSPATRAALIDQATKTRDLAAASLAAASAEVARMEAEAARFRNAPTEERGLMGDMVDNSLRDNLAASNAELAAIKATLAEAQAALDRAGASAGGVATGLQTAGGAARDAVGYMDRLRGILDDVADGEKMLRQLEAENDLRRVAIQYGEQSREYAQRRAEAEFQAFSATLKASNEASGLNERLRQAFLNGQALANVNIAAGVNAAVQSASALVEKYGIALSLANALAGVGLSGNAPSLAEDGRGSQREVAADGREFVSARARDAAARRAAKYQAGLVGGGAGGGGGGGANDAEQAAQAYQSLIASLDPLAAASQEFAKAQDTINKALAGGAINAQEAARAYGLAEERFKSASSAGGEAASVWATFQQAGGNALDRLIDGAGSLRDVLKDVIKELITATIKKRLLGSVSGGSASDSLGTLLFKGIFGGFKGLFDEGGTIGMGGFGIVGEKGPEVVRSTPSGAVVTSRANTARMMQRQAPAAVQVIGGDLTLSDNGTIMAQVRVMSQQAAQAGASGAVQQIKSSWGGLNAQFQQDGALA